MKYGMNFTSKSSATSNSSNSYTFSSHHRIFSLKLAGTRANGVFTAKKSTQHHNLLDINRGHYSRKRVCLITRSSQFPPGGDGPTPEAVSQMLSELAVPAISLLVLTTLLSFVIAIASPTVLFAFVSIACAAAYFFAPKYDIDANTAVTTVLGITVGALILPSVLKLGFFALTGFFIVNFIFGQFLFGGNLPPRQPSSPSDSFNSDGDNFNQGGFSNFNDIFSRRNMDSIEAKDMTIDVEAETIDD